MKRQGQFAYTLIELMVGLFLIFSAASCLFSTYAFGTKANLGTDRFTTAINLGQAKMEELQSRPYTSLPDRQQGKFAQPYQNYSWSADLSDFSEDFALLTLYTGYNGAPLCTLRRLLAKDCPSSISAHIYDSEASFTDRTFSSPFGKYNFWLTRSVEQKLVGSFPKGEMGAMCGYPAQGIVWLAYLRQPKLCRLIFDGDGNHIGTKLVNVPKLTYGYEADIVDMAADQMGCFVFCADRANQSVWVLDDSQNQGQVSWSNGRCLTSRLNPLKDLRSIACDQYGTSAWICEGQPRRLRQFYWGSLPKSFEEKINNYAAWGSCFEVPFSGSGRLHSVAVNSWGSAVYTIDNNFLYGLLFQECSGLGQWSKTPMPSELCRSAPRALWVDPGSSIIYINTLYGGQWAAKPLTDGSLSPSCFSKLSWR
ncbi:MAG: hypothetical protein ACI38Q_03280 [Candidatus Bruticola sp.]